MLFEINNMHKDKDVCLYDLDEGFFKGNMFKNLYEQYKDYKPATFVGKDEQSELLLKIYKLCFAITDLNLYLAINPDDEEIYSKYKEYIMMHNKYLNEYERKYQVLDMKSDIGEKYSYGDKPWPWEGEYV